MTTTTNSNNNTSTELAVKMVLIEQQLENTKKEIEALDTNASSADSTIDPANPSFPSYADGMSKMSSGPAAILYTQMNKLIALLNEVQSKYLEMTKLETDVQSKTLASGAKAQRTAAKKQADGIIKDAVGTIVGGACTLAATGVGFGMEKVGDAASKLKASEAELMNAKNLDKLAADVQSHNLNNVSVAPAGGNAGLGQLEPSELIPATVDAPEVPANPGQPDVKRQYDELRNNNNLPIDPATDVYTPDYNNSSDVTKAMRHMQERPVDPALPNGRKELDDYRDKLADKISGLQKDTEKYQSQITSAQTKWSGYGQIGNSIATATGKMLQATDTTAAGVSQANQQVASGVAQMAGGTAESTKQANIAAGNKIGEVIGAARSGAQSANAQT